MESDPTRMCELLVGLPDVNVIGVAETTTGLRITDQHAGGPTVVSGL